MNHGNAPARALKEKQAQADVLRVFKRLVSDQPFNVIYHWVPSHQDEKKPWEQCSVKERVNIKVDHLCKAVLIDGVRSDSFIDSVFLSRNARLCWQDEGHWLPPQGV